MKKILVTGGAGYIGSHTVVELLKNGYEVAVIDNFDNSKPEALTRVAELAGRSAEIFEVDLLDSVAVRRVVSQVKPDATIHFAGLKAVGESTEIPRRYYQVNVAGTLGLLDALEAAGCHRLVFSSSSTVYDPDLGTPPFEESAPLRAINPYGRSKWFVEEILRDAAAADTRWQIGLLRYFNPVGAHPSGRIGEDPSGIPNNLLPFISQVAVGRRDRLKVFGADYDTPDGTCIRDYIHVVDVARGHLRCIEYLARMEGGGCRSWNLGTGKGSSVLEMVKAFEQASGVDIPYDLVGRRAGDQAVSFCDPSRAREELQWSAEYNVDAMCVDAWNWQHGNPNGYP